MADIAKIGFEAETSDLDTAETKLNALVPAAAKAESSAEQLAKQFEETGNAAQRMAVGVGKAAKKSASPWAKGAAASDAVAIASGKATTAIEEEARATDNLANARKRLGSVPSVKQWAGPWGAIRDDIKAANDNTNMFRANVGNIAAQFQDIGVTAAMGMNPLLIGLQQGTQLSSVLAGAMENGQTATQALITAFRQVIGVTALMTIGITALAAGLIQLVNWTKLAQAGLNFIADILPKIAETATFVGAALAIAFAPAIATAIWGIATALTAGLLTALAGIITTIGAIPIAIGLIIADLIIFRDAWTQTLGVDIIGVVKNAVNYIIGAFVGAFHDIEFTVKNFFTILEAAAIGVGNAVINAVNTWIKIISDGLDFVINKINNVIATLGGASAAEYLGFSGKIPTIDASGETFKPMANKAADDLANAVQDRNKQLEKDLKADYIGAIGTAVTGAATYVAGKLKSFSASLGDTDKKKGRGRRGKTDEEKFDDILKGVDQNIASLQAEAAAIHLNELAAMKLTKETELLNQAKQKGIKLNDDQRNQLIALAHGMAELEYATKKQKEAIAFGKDVVKGFFSDMFEGLKQGKSFWESFGDAALNVLNKIADKLLNDVLNALFTVQDAGSGIGGGGGGSILGNLFGWLFNAKGNVFDKSGVKMFAKGDSFTNKVVNRPTPFNYAGASLGVMGEKGPEAILPLMRGPDGSLGVQMHAQTPQQQSGPQITYAPQYNVAQGADPRAIEELRKAQNDDRANFDRKVLRANANWRRRGADI